MSRRYSFAERRTLPTRDDYLIPVDQRFEDPERDVYEAPLDCATLQSEMLATLAMRDAARRRAAALRAARQNRKG